MPTLELKKEGPWPYLFEIARIHTAAKLRKLLSDRRQLRAQRDELHAALASLVTALDENPSSLDTLHALNGAKWLLVIVRASK